MSWQGKAVAPLPAWANCYLASDGTANTCLCPCSIRRPEVPYHTHEYPNQVKRGRHLTSLLRSLVGTGNVDKAAIFNSEGNSVWATTAGFTVRHA